MAGVVNDLTVWLTLAIILPLIINVSIFILVILTIMQLRKLRAITESITSSTHWLSRTAIRVGLGATAKKALVEYARTKDELKSLVPAAPGDKKTN